MVQALEQCGERRRATTEMLNDVGFTDVEVKKLPHDFQNYYYTAYKNK